MDDGVVHLDPKTLFSELWREREEPNKLDDVTTNFKKLDHSSQRRFLLPQLFRNSHFHYFSPADFPNHEPPNDNTAEVAFLGRSNTGKSSLINALSSLFGSVSRGSGGGEIARTSKRPGRTQTVNYFGLIPNEFKNNPTPDQSKMYLCDLPGFGFAKASDESVDDWQRKTQDFLISRISPEQAASSEPAYCDSIYDSLPPLRRLYLLIDSRLTKPSPLDVAVMGWCDQYEIPYTLVLTKVDGTNRASCVRLTNLLCMRYHSLKYGVTEEEEDGGESVFMDPIIHWTSSKKGLGIAELLMSVHENIQES